MDRSLRVDCLHELIPLVGCALLILREGFRHELSASVRRGKVGSQVILECLLVRFAKCLLELSKKAESFGLVLFYFVCNRFLDLHLLLNQAIVTAMDKNALPHGFVPIDVDSVAVHDAAFPFAIVARSVDVYHFAATLHETLVPLASVDIAAAEAVAATAVHFVFDPVAVVLFGAAATLPGEDDLAMTVLQLVPVE